MIGTFSKPKLLTIQLAPDKLSKKVEVEILKTMSRLSDEQVKDLLGYSVPSIIALQLGTLLEIFATSLCGYLLIFLDKEQIYVSADVMKDILDEPYEHETKITRAKIDLIKGKLGVYSLFYPRFWGSSTFPDSDVKDLLLAYTGQVYSMMDEAIREKIKSALGFVVGQYINYCLKNPGETQSRMAYVHTHVLYPKLWKHLPTPESREVFPSILQELIETYIKESGSDFGKFGLSHLEHRPI